MEREEGGEKVKGFLPFRVLVYDSGVSRHFRVFL